MDDGAEIRGVWSSASCALTLEIATCDRFVALKNRPGTASAPLLADEARPAAAAAAVAKELMLCAVCKISNVATR